MNSSNQQSFSINPETLYTPAAIAREFQVDVSWVKKNLIKTRACRFRKQGAVYVIKGQWLIEWAEAEHELPDES